MTGFFLAAVRLYLSTYEAVRAKFYKIAKAQESGEAFPLGRPEARLVRCGHYEPRKGEGGVEDTGP